MDDSTTPDRIGSGSRDHVCEYCAAIFVASRSVQRFCSDLCRLHNWRSRRSVALAGSESGKRQTAILVAEVARLQRQVGELQEANGRLREALSRAEMRLLLAGPRYRRWGLADGSES